MSEINKDIKIFTDINFNDIDYQPSAIGEYSFITKDENGSYIRTSDGDKNFISLSEFREQQLNKLLL